MPFAEQRREHQREQDRRKRSCRSMMRMMKARATAGKGQRAPSVAPSMSATAPAARADLDRDAQAVEDRRKKIAAPARRCRGCARAAASRQSRAGGARPSAQAGEIVGILRRDQRCEQRSSRRPATTPSADTAMRFSRNSCPDAGERQSISPPQPRAVERRIGDVDREIDHDEQERDQHQVGDHHGTIERRDRS